MKKDDRNQTITAVRFLWSIGGKSAQLILGGPRCITWVPKALPTRILNRQKQISLLSETHLKIFIKCLDFCSSSEADSLNVFLCKKTSAVEIHRLQLQLVIDVIADRHQEVLGIYCKLPFKRPGRLFDFRNPSAGAFYR